MPTVPLKPLYWIASSLKDLKAMPVPLQKAFGTALRSAPLGGMPRVAKPLRGFGGAGVLELVEDYDRGTYRAVYTVNFPGVVYMLHDADELLAKADLAHTIQQLIQAQGLSQRAAARRLGVAQPDLSNLYRGRLDSFSIERLCRLLTALGQDVRIVVQPKPRSRSRATLRATVGAD